MSLEEAEVKWIVIFAFLYFSISIVQHEWNIGGWVVEAQQTPVVQDAPEIQWYK